MRKLRSLLVLALAFQPAALVANDVIVETDRFELRSEPRINLHHFLIAWAAAEAEQWPPYALPVVERGYWRALLDDEEERLWAAAAGAYAAVGERNVVFDEGLVALRDWAAGTAPREAIPAADRALAEALERALPVYERRWWRTQDAQNRAWIEAVSDLVIAVENAAVPRLEAAYGGRWPDARIPVDVVIYANAVGAYSTGGRVTISSADYGNRMPQALELIFHEASHTAALESPLTRQVDEAFNAVGRKAPERFWHDLIFFTTGTITRTVLAEHGQAGYRHYGEFGVYRRGERWAAQLPLLERHWEPYLQSASADANARLTALKQIAESLP